MVAVLEEIKTRPKTSPQEGEEDEESQQKRHFIILSITILSLDPIRATNEVETDSESDERRQ